MTQGLVETLRKHHAFLAVWLVYAVFLIWSLPEYGVTWDVFAEFPRGTSFVDQVLPDGPGAANRSPWKGLAYETAASSHFTAQNACLPSLVAALSGKVFFEYLRILGPIDAYHLGLTLLWLGATLYIYARLTQLYSRTMAVCSVMFLMLAPRVMGHVPNNMKDVPAMAFVAMAVLDVACAFKLDRPRQLCLAGLFLGAAVSSKLTAGIGLIPVAVVLLLQLRHGGLPRRFWLPLASAPLLVLAVFVGFWPYLWAPPLELWHKLVEWREVIAIRGGTRSPSLYPVVMFIVTTPVPALLFGFGSLIPLWKSKQRALLYTCGVWLAGVLAVFCSGAIELFDGIRHFLHFWPPLAFLGGWGVSALVGKLCAREPRLAPHATPVAALGLIVLLAPSIALYHPYEVTYFNFLVGGLPGATKLEFDPERVLDFEPRDYWGTSVRRAVRWGNDNLPGNAVLSVSLPPTAPAAYTYREDLQLAYPTLGVTEFLILLNRPRWFGDTERVALDRGEIVHVEQARGVPLCFVIRMPAGR